MAKLDKSDLRKGWLKWAMFHLSSMSFEKLEAHGFAHSMTPIIKKLYKDKPEEQREALKRHSVFYNTEPQVGSVVNGVVASIEEERANGQPISDEMFHSIKTGLMGPVAGIGDSTIQGIIIPILLTIAMSISHDGNPFGVIFYMFAYLAVMGSISYWLYFRGYKLGTKALDGLMGPNADRIKNALTVLGTMVIGGLAASSVKLATAIQIPNGDEFIQLQKTLDGFFPGLLALIAVLISWYLISIKKIGATKVLLFLVAISVVGVLVGLF